jgi:hypothetical protein
LNSRKGKKIDALIISSMVTADFPGLLDSDYSQNTRGNEFRPNLISIGGRAKGCANLASGRIGRCKMEANSADEYWKASKRRRHKPLRSTLYRNREMVALINKVRSAAGNVKVQWWNIIALFPCAAFAKCAEKMQRTGVKMQSPCANNNATAPIALWHSVCAQATRADLCALC